MKKRIFSLLLAVSMILGMIVVPAAAEPAETASAPSQSYEADIWYEAYTAEDLFAYFAGKTTTDPKSINCEENKTRTVGVRLMADVDTKMDKATNHNAVFYVGYYNSDDAALCYPVNAVFDLNGHTITDTSDNHRMFGVYSGSKLVITNGTILANGTYGAAGGTIMTNKACDVTLDGLTLISTDPTDRSGGAEAVTGDGSDGGLYYASTDGSKLTVINSYLEKSAGVVNEGGLLCMSNKATVTITNSVLVGGKAIRGGAICGSASVTLNMTDTQVIGGEAVSTTSATANRGGNIFFMGTGTLTRCTINGGIAAQDGGNIYFQKKVTMKDCTVENGFGGGLGNNIYSGGATVTVDGGKITGGFYSTGKVIFTGAPVVSNYDYEGVDVTVPAEFENLTQGAKIVINGEGALSTADVTAYLEAGYILPCTRTALTLTEGILTGTATTNGYCPHCKQNVDWVEYTAGTVATGHYYVGDMSSVKPKTIAAGSDVVIDLRGVMKTIERAVVEGTFTLISSLSGGGVLDSVLTSQKINGPVASVNGGTVNIYGGTINGAYTKNSGGAFYAYGSGQLNLYNGRITGGEVESDEADEKNSGGNVYIGTNTTFTIYGGMVDGGKASSSLADTTAPGGNVEVNAGYLVMHGGVIRGGSATGAGGNVNCKKNADFTMHGGVILGGSATSGGNVHFTEANDATINDGMILSGHASGGGGNLYCAKSTKLEINDGMILSGHASGNGGNLYCSSSTKLEINDGTIFGGVADERGGNLYVAGGTVEVTINDCLMSGGIAGVYGGNAFINNGKFYLYGGTISDGTAEYGGGNLYLNAGFKKVSDGVLATSQSGNICVIGAKTAEDDGPVITGGRVKTTDSKTYSGAGGNISLMGELQLGKATITGGTAVKEGTGDLFIAKTSSSNAPTLTVTSDFTGDLSVYINSANNGNALTKFTVDTYGASVFEHFTAQGALNGTLRLTSMAGAPTLYAGEGGVLTVSAGALVDENGAYRWFTDANTAAAQRNDNEYLKLFAAENVVTATNGLTVDLNGNNLTVNGNINISGFDTANDDFDGYGTLTAAEATVEATMQPSNGNYYITVADGSAYSFHRLSQGITNVVLRPNVAGIYYNAAWECDDVLAAKIKTKGIALSTAYMPGDNFVNDGKVMYTQLSNENADTSVLVENIISTESNANNQLRGTTPIYATAYVVVGDETFVSQETDPQIPDVSYDIKTVAEKVDRLWNGLSDTQQAGLRSMYNRDAATLSTWGLYNLSADVNGTAAVRPLKILTLGHSLAVDSGHMLNLVAGAEGYKSSDYELIVGTLYKSGCKLTEHVEFLTENKAAYSLYISSSATPDQPPEILPNYTMEKALVYDDWDIIIMQGGVFEIGRESDMSGGNIQIIQDYVNQHKKNPDAIFAWHMQWATPEDTELQDTYKNGEPESSYKKIYQETYANRMEFYNKITSLVDAYIVPNDTFYYLIPSGTAVQNALSSYLEEKDLHRDYVHMSDLGRVISSYTWYCTLMGVEHLDEIKLNAIPVAFFKSTTGTEDRVLTQAEKDVILESVNNALANPLQMTQSQYTEAPQ